MLQQTLTQLQWRAAIKEYDTSKKLSDEQRNLIIESARLAPTAYGVQPIKIYHVITPELREKLAEVGYNQPAITQASDYFVLAARTTVTEKDMMEFLHRTADQRGVTLESLDGFKTMLLGLLSGKTDQELHDWSARQAYLVLGMMITVAAINNIDVTPMEGFIPDRFDEVLGISAEGFHTVCACAVGFRASTDTYSKQPKVRKTLAEFVSVK